MVLFDKSNPIIKAQIKVFFACVYLCFAFTAAFAVKTTLMFVFDIHEQMVQIDLFLGSMRVEARKDPPTFAHFFSV